MVKDDISLLDPSDEEPELSEKEEIPMYDQEENEDDRLEDEEEDEVEAVDKEEDEESEPDEIDLGIHTEVLPEDTCYQQYVLPSDSEDGLDELDFELSEEEEIEEKTKEHSQRRTKPFITKYEKVRILSFRANQIARGAAAMLTGTEGLTFAQIALKEYEQKIIPIKIKRPLPDGTVERFKITELQDLDR